MSTYRIQQGTLGGSGPGPSPLSILMVLGIGGALLWLGIKWTQKGGALEVLGWIVIAFLAYDALSWSNKFTTYINAAAGYEKSFGKWLQSKQGGGA